MRCGSLRVSPSELDRDRDIVMEGRIEVLEDVFLMRKDEGSGVLGSPERYLAKVHHWAEEVLQIMVGHRKRSCILFCVPVLLLRNIQQVQNPFYNRLYQFDSLENVVVFEADITPKRHRPPGPSGQRFCDGSS